MSQYVSVNTFGGLNKNDQLIVPIDSSINNILSTCLNFNGLPDYNSSSLTAPLIGMITKAPTVTSYAGTMPAAGRARGLFNYLPEVSLATKNFVMASQCTTDYSVGKLYVLDRISGTWYTLATTAAPYHSDFAQYNTRVYTTFDGSVLKWNGDLTNWSTVAPAIRDKGGTAVAIAGAVLTWNLTTTVTSDIDISALISKGDYIRRSSTSPYWDEVLTVAVGGLSLTLSSASSDTGASVAGAAQRAAYIAVSKPAMQPYFIKFWKDKMWLAGNGKILYWSATGDVENFSGTGAGYMTISLDEEQTVSAMATLGDYIFFFKDTVYYVYRWTGDIDAPIEFVKKFYHGCISHRTIQEINETLIYLAEGDVRQTNGITDVSISNPIGAYLKTNIGSSISQSYFALSSAADSYPWAYVDKFRLIYSLVIPATASNCIILNYNYETGKWIGSENYFDAGTGALVYRDTETHPSIVISKMASSNQLNNFFPVGGTPKFRGDTTTAGILESATFYSGLSNKKIKIIWVEFDVHPLYYATYSISTTLIFNYRKDFEAIDTSRNQSKLISYNANAPGITLDRAYIRTKARFQVNDIFDTFSWYLTETVPGAGYNDISIVGWTICYTLCDTV